MASGRSFYFSEPVSLSEEHILDDFQASFGSNILYSTKELLLFLSFFFCFSFSFPYLPLTFFGGNDTTKPPVGGKAKEVAVGPRKCRAKEVADVCG